MTERKFKSYTLWLKWLFIGWKPYVTCLNLPWPSDNPISVLRDRRMVRFKGGHWKRGKTWMILPEGRRPK